MTSFRALTVCLIFLPAMSLAENSTHEASEVIELPCPDMTYFANPAIDASVTRDPKTNEYLYRYDLHARDGDPAVNLVALRAFADSRIERWGEGFALCNMTRRNAFQEPAVFCLAKKISDPKVDDYQVTLRSAAAPGVIEYEVESAIEKGILSGSLVEQLEAKFGGDRPALFESLQEEIGSQCPSGRVASDRDRRLVGTVQGPSTRIGNLTGNKSGDELNVAADKTFDLSSIDNASVRVSDPLGGTYVIEGAAVARRAEGSASYKVVLADDSPPVACNIKALLVDGQSLDGRPFRASILSGAPDCAPSIRQTFKIKMSASP